MFGNIGNQGAPIEVKTSTVRMEDGKEYMKFTFPDAATKEGVSNLLDERFANYSDRDTPDKKSLDLFVPVGVEQGTDNVQNAQSIISEKYNPQFKAEVPQQSVSQPQMDKAHMADLSEFRKLQEQRDSAKSQEQKDAPGEAQGLPFGSTSAASLTGRQPVQVAPVAEPEKAKESPLRRFWNAIKTVFRDAFKKEEKTETSKVAATGNTYSVDERKSNEPTIEDKTPARDSYYNLEPVNVPGPRPNPGDPVRNPSQGQYAQFSGVTEGHNQSQGQYANFSAVTGSAGQEQQYAKFSSVTDQASKDQQGKVDQAELKSAIEGLQNVKDDLVKPSGPPPSLPPQSTKPVVGAATAALNRQSNAAPSQGRQ